MQGRTGGEQGNSRLTSSTGLLLALVLFLEGVTVPLVHRLVLPHIFIGFILIPPIVLKLGSTGYRFAMYYAGNQRYRALGPPFLPLRLAAPVLIVTTIVLFWSGIELLIFGPQHEGIWKRVHVASFILWFGVMTIHVLGHMLRAGSLGLSDMLPVRAFGSFGQSSVAGALTRRNLVAGSLILGFVLAIVLLPLDHSWAGFSGGR
jgi:hypothetical protein